MSKENYFFIKNKNTLPRKKNPDAVLTMTKHFVEVKPLACQEVNAGTLKMTKEVPSIDLYLKELFYNY